MTAIKQHVSSYIGVGTLRLSALILATLSSLIVARQLGPFGYGQVAIVLAVLSIMSIPSNNALNPLIVREVARFERGGDNATIAVFIRWSRRLAFNVVGVAVVLVGICGTVLWLGRDDDLGSLLLLAVPLLVGWAVAARVAAILQGLNRVVLAQSFDWFITPVTYLLLVVLLWWLQALTPHSVLVALLFASFVAMVAGLAALKAYVPDDLLQLGDAKVSESWSSGWRTFVIIQGLSVVNLKMPILLLGGLASESDAGVYRVAESIATLLSMTLLVANGVIAPQIAKFYANGDFSAVGRLVKSAARYSLAISFPVALVLLAFGGPIINFLFGVQFVGAAAVLSILVVGQIINIATGSVGLILNMTGNENGARNAWIVSLLLNIVLGAVLIPTWGATGAAIAATVSIAIWNILLLTQVKRVIGVRPSVI